MFLNAYAFIGGGPLYNISFILELDDNLPLFSYFHLEKVSAVFSDIW